MPFASPVSPRPKRGFGWYVCLLLAWLPLLAGCAPVRVPRDSDLPVDPVTQACVHLPSGTVFPKHAAGQDRVSVTCDMPWRGCVTAYYTKARVPVPVPEMAFYVNSHVSVVPATSAAPEKLMEWYLRDCADAPSFVRGEYRGRRVFGADTPLCAECSFERPGWNDRVVMKIAVFRRGKYLVCFRFLVSAAYAREWQDAIDRFIAEIVEPRGKESGRDERGRTAPALLPGSASPFSPVGKWNPPSRPSEGIVFPPGVPAR